MTIALIVLFTSLAICALIGWVFIRVVGVIARRLGRQSLPVRRGSDPIIIFREATADELAERARIRGEPLPMGHVETYFEDGRWKNKIFGNSRASNVHDTKAIALDAGREMARKRNVDHIIMNEDGTVQERSHGGDFRPVLS